MNLKKYTSLDGLRLDLSNKKLKRIPDNVTTLINLKNINLSDNFLTEVPKEMWLLKDLEVLDLSYNLIKTIPEGIGVLKKLRRLHIFVCYLTELPYDIVGLDSLTDLDLRHNELESIPEYLNELKNLQVLRLNGNNLRNKETKKILKPLVNRGCIITI